MPAELHYRPFWHIFVSHSPHVCLCYSFHDCPKHTCSPPLERSQINDSNYIKYTVDWSYRRGNIIVRALRDILVQFLPKAPNLAEMLFKPYLIKSGWMPSWISHGMAVFAKSNMADIRKKIIEKKMKSIYLKNRHNLLIKILSCIK